MISIPLRIVSKRELMMPITNDDVVRGWQIECRPMDPDPTNQDLVLANDGLVFVTLLPEVAAQYTVGEQTALELPGSTAPRPRLHLVGGGARN